jgi:hypothetical protein
MESGQPPTPRPTFRARRSSPVVTVVAIGFAIAFCAIIYRAASPDHHGYELRRTRRLVHELDAAIRSFGKDFGRTPDMMPPSTPDGDTNRRLRRWLTGLDDNGDPDEAVRSDPRWQGPYAEPDVESLDSDRGHILVDSWRNPILFEFEDPIFNPGRWDIWSLGPDGEGTSNMADIASGTPEQRRERFEQVRQKRHLVNADTIGNWE